MSLIYKGKRGEFINDVPARDLTDTEVQEIAQKWGLSMAETEGLLIKHKLYAVAPKANSKAAKTESEG
jgi:hypothetical protein